MVNKEIKLESISEYFKWEITLDLDFALDSKGNLVKDSNELTKEFKIEYLDDIPQNYTRVYLYGVFEVIKDCIRSNKKFIKFNEEPIRVMIKTTDDWSPNFDNNKVKLSYLGLIAKNTYRVCIWGADDCGMEYDTPNKNDAKTMFEKLKQQGIVTKKELEKLKFNFC